jgi:glutamate racemase
MLNTHPIGVFDSGFGGLTILKQIIKTLPTYDYIYLGDNARAPYGPKNFETVYQYTLEAVKWLFSQGCPLVILACNTASAKALRTIQQKDLINLDPNKRVLGVIRPTTEVIGEFTTTEEIGILGTQGTVDSSSYLIEISKSYPSIKVFQQACPAWVPLVESGDFNNKESDGLVKECIDRLLKMSPNIDTILLACTHYPLLMDKIKAQLPNNVQVIEQGNIVAQSLQHYLDRHEKMKMQISASHATSTIQFYTTGDAREFASKATYFWGEPIEAKKVNLLSTDVLNS